MGVNVGELEKGQRPNGVSVQQIQAFVQWILLSMPCCMYTLVDKSFHSGFFSMLVLTSLSNHISSER